MPQLQLGDIAVDVVLKDIKNVHLSVYPPTGRVRISAPEGMSIDTIRLFAIAKLDWIKLQQQKQLGQDRESAREYLDRESHYVWGRRYLLRVVEADARSSVQLEHDTLVLAVRSAADVAARQATLSEWYRQILKAEVQPLLAAWEPRLGVTVSDVFVQQMKTKWGSCNPSTRTIRLNTELAKKPAECLEYIVLHEMVHLLEPRHNPRFVALMSQFMPSWEHYRRTLNRLPVGHATWAY
jgi:predicted metal-dependent hydrolase